MVHLFGVQNSQISCKYPQQRSLEFWSHHCSKLGPPKSASVGVGGGTTGSEERRLEEVARG